MSRLLILVLILAPRLAAQFNLNQRPSRALGHARLELASSGPYAPNLVEGRELNAPQGIAVDVSVNPALLYVADTGNNRVLAWKNAASFGNGAPADRVIGQRNFYSTSRGGPGTGFSTGLFNPAGLAVDRGGNLYIVDTGNNRILRFPRPFAQSEQLPNLVIGQTNFNSSQAGVSERSVFTSITVSGSAVVYGGSLAFDQQDNLWFLDSGNNRVLRYPASALGTDATNGPAADLVLGQVDFASRVAAPQTAAGRLQKGNFVVPSGLAFDPAGRLFVADNNARVLVFVPPFQTAKEAARIMGVLAQGTTNPCPQSTLAGDIQLRSPEGIFMTGNQPGVIDVANHRIMLFDSFDQWPAEATLFSPRARSVGPVGQADTCAEKPNRGQPEPGANSLRLPSHAVAAGNELFVSDAGNHRVLVFPVGGLGSTATATRELGQDAFHLNSPNLVEGREFGLAGTIGNHSGLVVDWKSDPPRLYVSDSYNNRVLVFRDVRRVRPGDQADLVIGQPDFQRTLPNYPFGDADRMSSQSLSFPTGLLLDSDGNLYVADSGNGRVLRFPKPFDQPNPNYPRADLVLGQTGFTAKITDPTARTMAFPYGLAFAGDNGLLVSDTVHNRVLFFRGRPSELSSGQASIKVFGQPDFSTSASGSGDNRMNGPQHIATDTDDRLYVADLANSRILIFNRAPVAETNPRAAVILSQIGAGNSLFNPRGIFVNPTTGEIWVSEQTNRLLRFPKFDDLPAANNFINFAITMPAGVVAMAVAQDMFGDLLVADSTHRVAIYYPGISAVNAANAMTGRALAPGAWAMTKRQAHDFTAETLIADKVPFPTLLGDVQVLVNDVPAPLYYVSPTQINFLVPNATPTSGTVEMQVVRASTGQILGAGPVEMNDVSPGFFTVTGSGNGQLVAVNEDNSLNSATNAIARGQILTLYGTGQGLIPGGPADGTPAAGALETPDRPRIFFLATEAQPLYSGLAPGFVGLWQINVRVPMEVVPNNAVRLVVIHKSVPSMDAQRGVITTVAVKQ